MQSGTWYCDNEVCCNRMEAPSQKHSKDYLSFDNMFKGMAIFICRFFVKLVLICQISDSVMIHSSITVTRGKIRFKPNPMIIFSTAFRDVHIIKTLVLKK